MVQFSILSKYSICPIFPFFPKCSFCPFPGIWIPVPIFFVEAKCRPALLGPVAHSSGKVCSRVLGAFTSECLAFEFDFLCPRCKTSIYSCFFYCHLNTSYLCFRSYLVDCTPTVEIFNVGQIWSELEHDKWRAFSAPPPGVSRSPPPGSSRHKGGSEL